MYKILADNQLIYDSTIDDYKIGKGNIDKEINKAGSFIVSIFPDHVFYDSFIELKTVIKVLKDNNIIFRGRVLNDSSDYWNAKTLTCEGELGFFNDSCIRPFEFAGTPRNFLKKIIDEHNAQVDDFKKFKLGNVTVTGDIGRESTEYMSSWSILSAHLLEESTGGYLFVTHENGDEIPTLHYLSDFTDVSKQSIEFGSNLMDFVKTRKSEEIATAIIPLGATIEDDDSETVDPRLTIVSVNNRLDYIVDDEAVALRGWILKPVVFDEISDATELMKKGREYLESVKNQNITIEVKAIDLHLLDRNIESFKLGEYIPVISRPHNFNVSMLCNRMTIDLLSPQNDTLVLGYSYSTFTERMRRITSGAINLLSIQQTVNSINNRVIVTDKNASDAVSNYQNVVGNLGQMTGDLEIIAGVATENARNIAVNAEHIATNAENIQANSDAIRDILARLSALES